jgi:cytochrome c6
MDALIYQITNGKNGMPAFGGRLRDLEIEELAIYVLQNNFN